MRIILSIVSLLLSTSAFAAGGVPNQGIESIRVVQISPRDGRAVVKTPDGAMQMIKVGDTVGDGGRVTEIAKDRVVMETGTGQGAETVIFRLDGSSRTIERLRKTGERQPDLYLPQEQGEGANGQ
jgi:hypothetical protein